MATSDIGVMMNHLLPEKVSPLPVSGIPRDFMECGQPHKLRDLRVGMFARQNISAFNERVQNHFVMEAARGSQVALFTRICIEVSKNFIDSPMLTKKETLHLFLIKPLHRIPEIIRKFFSHLQRLLVPTDSVSIPQACQLLMVGVEWHPDAVQVKAF